MLRALTPWLMAVLLVLVYGLVGALDAANASEANAQRAEALLMDCMNGNLFLRGEGIEVGCMKAESNARS